MTKDQEALQAETVAECKKWHEATEDRGGSLKSTVVHAQRGALLEIVDHQAQKIAEQAKEIERLRNVTNAISFGSYTALEVRLHMEKLADFDAKRLKP